MSEIDSLPSRRVNIRTFLIIIFSLIGIGAIVITLLILFSNPGTIGGDS